MTLDRVERQTRFPDWLRNTLAGLLLFNIAGIFGVVLSSGSTAGIVLVGLAGLMAVSLTAPGKRWRAEMAPWMRGGWATSAAVLFLMIGAGVSDINTGDGGGPEAAAKEDRAPIHTSTGTPQPVPTGSSAQTPLASYDDVLPAEPEGVVSRGTFEGLWPLTVEEGKIGCDPNGRAWFETNDGKRFALNGTARSVYAEPEPIWAMDRAAMAEMAALNVPGTRRINITDLLNAALELCPGR